MYDFTMTLCWS